MTAFYLQNVAIEVDPAQGILGTLRICDEREFVKNLIMDLTNQDVTYTENPVSQSKEHRRVNG